METEGDYLRISEIRMMAQLDPNSLIFIDVICVSRLYWEQYWEQCFIYWNYDKKNAQESPPERCRSGTN